MMKKIAYILPLVAGTLFTTVACEDDYREPTTIVNNYISEYKELLTAEGTCWRFDYYPDATQYGAFNFLMSFAKDGRVTMQTDKNFFYLFASEEELQKPYEPQTSDYTIQNSQGPVLTFATYSLLSKLADPTFVDHNFGSGWTGDNEFILKGHSATEDTIYLKSVRAQQTCYLVRDSVDVPIITDLSKKDSVIEESIKKYMNIYFEQLNKVVDEFVGTNVANPYFRDIEFAGQEEGKEAVMAGFDMTTRSGVVYQKVNGRIVADTCVVRFSPEGVHLRKPMTVNGVEVREFVYNEEQGCFLINNEDGSTIKMAENGRPKFRFSVRNEVFRGMFEYVSGRDTILREDNYQLAYNPKSAEDEWKVLYESLENYAMMSMFANDTEGMDYIFAIYDQYQDKTGRTVPCIAQCPLLFYWASDDEDEDMITFIGAATSSLLYASQNENYVYEMDTDLAKEYKSRIEKPLKNYLNAIFGSAFTPIECIIVPSPDYESFSFVNVKDGTDLVIFKN